MQASHVSYEYICGITFTFFDYYEISLDMSNVNIQKNENR